MLDELGLNERRDVRVGSLSGGQRKRVSVALELLTRPSLLILDEPTASLDPASTAAIESIVMRAHSRGTKIIFVTHDIGQARRLGDDVVFLHRGRVAEHSPAKTFFDQPLSQAAADYLAGRLVLHR